MAEMRARPEYEDILHRKPAVPGDLEHLKSMPKGSLGRAYFDFMETHRLSLPVPGTKAPKDDFHYCIYRILNTHDLYHLLLNAPPDSFGEMIVAAFTDAQLPLYLQSSTHVAASLAFAAFARNTPTRFLLRGCAVGHLLGMQAQPLFAADWDTLWDLPLDVVRQRLDIENEKVEALVNGLYTARSVLKYPTLYELGAMGQYRYETLHHAGHDIPVYVPPGEIRGLCIVGRAMFTRGKYFHRGDEYNLTAALLGQSYAVAIPVPDAHREEDFIDLAKRQADIVHHLRDHFKQDPFLIGHSFSGVLYAWLCRQHGESLPVRGLITLSAGLWDRESMAGLTFRQKNTLRSYYYAMRIRQTTGQRVSRRKYFADAFPDSGAVSDQITTLPWRGRKNIPRNVVNILVRQNNRIVVPSLCVTGKEDKIMPLSVVEHFHERYLPSAERRIYGGLGHMDIAASDKASHVWNDITTWLVNH